MSAFDPSRGIIVGVDGSSFAKAAVWWAAREAAMRDVALNVVNVLTPAAVVWPGTYTPVRFGQRQEEQAKTLIAEAVAIAEQCTGGTGGLQVSSEVVVSSVVPTLVGLSKDAQMVVVGCRGRGAFERRLLGSVSFGLVHHAQCPVAVIHDEYPAAPRAGHARIGVSCFPRPQPYDARARDVTNTAQAVKIKNSNARRKPSPASASRKVLTKCGTSA